jgi:hypothetical protein
VFEFIIGEVMVMVMVMITKEAVIVGVDVRMRGGLKGM